MKLIFQITMLILTTAPLSSLAQVPEFNENSNFSDHLKTDSATGEPLLHRNGQWVSAEKRLEDLVKTTRDVVRSSDAMDDMRLSAASRQSAIEAAKARIHGLGIPAGVFTDSKFDRTIKDPKLQKIMELEWYLGSATKMNFEGLGMNSWRNCGFAWYVDNSKKDLLLARVIAKVEGLTRPSLASRAIGTIKKGILPAVAIVGTSYFLSSNAKAASQVGSENSRPVSDGFNDNDFGPSATH